MAYKYTQVQAVNYLLMGAKKGWCLKNTMLAFGGVAEGYHPSATYELGKTVLHKEAPPKGVAVPVWWDTGVKDGHVNISTGDGRLCNDGQFVNYADFAKKYKLLGWGETICGRRIVNVEVVPDAPVTPPNSFLPARGHIQRGDTGNNVKALNAFMRKTFPAYSSAKVLGSLYGPVSEASIKEFQRRTGLLADGCVGKITLAKLQSYGFKY